MATHIDARKIKLLRAALKQRRELACTLETQETQQRNALAELERDA